MNDKKANTMLICLAVILVLGIMTMVISLEQKKGWKAYLEQNQSRLK